MLPPRPILGSKTLACSEKRRVAMEEQSGTVGSAVKRGRWTALQRQQIVEASLVAGASINQVAVNVTS
jgi:hypothetical protein